MFSSVSNLQKVENIEKAVFRFVLDDSWNLYIVLLVMSGIYGIHIYFTHSPRISVQNYKQHQPGLCEAYIELDESKQQIR